MTAFSHFPVNNFGAQLYPSVWGIIRSFFYTREMHRLSSKSPVLGSLDRRRHCGALWWSLEDEVCNRKTCPDMILLTQCYYHRGPIFFAIYYDPTGMLRRCRCVRIFSLKTYSANNTSSTATAFALRTGCTILYWGESSK